MPEKQDILHILIAGLSGGFIRLRIMMKKGNKLNPLKIVFELGSAAICSFYVGDLLTQIVPSTWDWTDNFIHFIAGYGGMELVDFLYNKFLKKQ